MKALKTIEVLVLLMLLSLAAFSQTVAAKNSENKKLMETKKMQTYVIEREIPTAGNLNGSDLRTISQTSCSVLKDLGPQIQWVESYVTDNKIFCIYRAENEEILREHAKQGNFPINAIHPLNTMIGPETAK
jgi:hypothetical protein